MIHEQIRLELLAMRAEDLLVARSVQIGLSLMYRHPTIRGSGGNSSRGKNLRNSTLGKATFRVLHLDRRIHLRVRASVVRIESVPVAQVLHGSSLRAPGRSGRTLKVSQFEG